MKSREHGNQTGMPRGGLARIPPVVYIILLVAVIAGTILAFPALTRTDGDRPEGSASAPQRATVGSKAPGFTLKDVNGNSYVVSPTDGKAHLLVFYMGYF